MRAGRGLWSRAPVTIRAAQPYEGRVGADPPAQIPQRMAHPSMPGRESNPPIIRFCRPAAHPERHQAVPPPGIEPGTSRSGGERSIR